MSRRTLAEQPAQQESRIDIYRSFEQWKSGNVLEHGVPRTEFYTKADLDLVEMGWRYGYDAGRAVEQALDKKAENERELGIQMQPNEWPTGCPSCGMGSCDCDEGTCNPPAKQELDPLAGDARDDWNDWRDDQGVYPTALNPPTQQEPVGLEPFGYFQYDIRLDAWVQNRVNNKGVAFYIKAKT